MLAEFYTQAALTREFNMITGSNNDKI